MLKEKRAEALRKRRNFFPTLLLTLLLWLTLSGIIYFIDPAETGAIPTFFIVSFLTIFFTSSILLVSSRRGLVVSLSFLIFLILRYFGQGNLLNLLLITGIAVAFEIYFSKLRG